MGNSVTVKDMFRLGKFHKPSGTTSSSRVQVRPILVKIATVWDRKLILMCKSRLREFKIKHLFVREDVPPEYKLRQRRSRPVPSVSKPEAPVVASVSSVPYTSATTTRCRSFQHPFLCHDYALSFFPFTCTD